MTVEMHSTAILKDLARRAFQAQNYTDALQLYLEALTHAAPAQPEAPEQRQQGTEPSEWAILASNIAAVLLKLDRPEEALEYSKAAVEAAPGWPKALYRQSAALIALQQHSQAVPLLLQLQRLVPVESAEAAAVAVKLQAAQAATTATAHQLQVQAQLMATHLAWADTNAREAAGRAALLEQLQQGMSGYAWEPSDWEWRPTWTPSMRHNSSTSSSGSIDSSNDRSNAISSGPPTQPAVAVDKQTASTGCPTDKQTASTGCPTEALQIAPSAALWRASNPPTRSYPAASLLDALAPSESGDHSQQQQYMQLLAGISKQLAELQGPKRGLALLADNPLLLWYKRGLAEAMQPAAATVLVIANGGGGVLGMLAAAAGATRVYVIEGGRWGYRAAKQLLEGNRKQQPGLVSKVELVPVPLSRCRYKEFEPTNGVHGNTNAPDAAAAVDVDVDKAVDANSGSAETDLARAHAAAGADSIKVAEQMVASAEEGLQRQQQRGASQMSSAGEDAYFYFELQANVVVTDLLDYSVLGQGLLPRLATAAASGLIASDATLLPHSVVMHGQLVNTQLTEKVSGFDLEPVNNYKWHPTVEHVQHEQLTHFQAASTPFQLHVLNLTAHLAQNMPSTSNYSHSCSSLQHSSPASTQLLADCDALLLWFHMCTKAGTAISTHPAGTSTAAENYTAGKTTSFDSFTSSTDGDDSLQYSNSCSADDDEFAASSCTCFGLGLYYLDTSISAALEEANSAAEKNTKQLGRGVTVASTVQHNLRLHCSVTSSSSSTSSNDGYSWLPHGFPRYAMLPRWHFDMIADDTRNRAYDAAIRRAIAAATADACPDGVHVLDIGTGTGLLALMAARGGASKVTAVESVRHLAETASTVTALNGYSRSIQVVHKDGRYLTVGKPSGTGLCDMMRPADLLAFEVFDCGLIGEGALHIVASARANLLQPGAKILPASAKVFCQPIQYNRQAAAALTNILDPSHMYAYAWQPDYFEADLRTIAQHDTTPTSDTATPSADSTDTQSAGGMCPGAVASDSIGKPHWLPLASPQLAFEFDFNCPDPMSAFQPAVQQLQFAVCASGVCNAVAFWFELKLDQQTCLSSSPHCCSRTLQSSQSSPSTTWKQAVQLLPEHQVCPGQQLSLTASHDTYAISFALTPTACAHRTVASSNLAKPNNNSSRTAAAPAVELTSPAFCAVNAAADAVAGNSRSGAACNLTAAAGSADFAEAAALAIGTPQPTGVPFVDPVWKAAYDNVCQVQSKMVKALTQDPLEYRKLVNAAMMVAMCPCGEESTAVQQGWTGTGATPDMDSSDAARPAREQLKSGAETTRSVLRVQHLKADPHHSAALLVRLMS